MTEMDLGRERGSKMHCCPACRQPLQGTLLGPSHFILQSMYKLELRGSSRTTAHTFDDDI